MPHVSTSYSLLPSNEFCAVILLCTVFRTAIMSATSGRRPRRSSLPIDDLVSAYTRRPRNTPWHQQHEASNLPPYIIDSGDRNFVCSVLFSRELCTNQSATNHQGQMMQGNSANMNASLQQIQGRSQMNTEIKQEVNMVNTQKYMTTDPSSIYGQAILQSKSGIANTGFNQRVTGLPLKGWPLTMKMPQMQQSPSQEQEVGCNNVIGF